MQGLQYFFIYLEKQYYTSLAIFHLYYAEIVDINLFIYYTTLYTNVTQSSEGILL